MTNTFIVPSVIAARGIATLHNNLTLAALVSRNFDAEWRGSIGDTITVRKPATFDATLFDTTARTTTWQDAVESSITLTLDKVPHVAFKVTDEQMTLQISQFQTQLLDPAMEALAQYIDGALAEAVVDAAEGTGGGGTATMGSNNPNYVFRKAREILNRNKLPVADRYAVLAPEAETVVLGDELLIAVDKSGATDALRNGIVGRIVGFETYMSQVFGYGSADKGQADGVAFHRDAMILAMRPLDVPRGVPAGNASVVNYKGLSLRVIYSYDHDAKSDKITVDTLFGTKAARPEAAVQLSFGIGS